MSQVQITLDSTSVAVLDSTAAALAFSREEALKEAIEQYSSYDRWFRTKVEEGLSALDAGDVMPDEQVDKECLELIDAITAVGPGHEQ